MKYNEEDKGSVSLPLGFIFKFSRIKKQLIYRHFSFQLKYQVQIALGMCQKSVTRQQLRR